MKDNSHKLNNFGNIDNLDRVFQNLLIILFRFRTIIVLVFLTIIFSSLSPIYLKPHNLIIMTKHVAINAIIAIGMTLVILTGGIDLSVGSIVGFTGMIAGGLIVEGLVLPMFSVTIYFRAIIIIFLGLGLGVLIGFINGVVISKFKVTPFIATLGTLYMARGLGLIRSKGATFPNLSGNPTLKNTGFEFLGGGKLLGIPTPIWLMLIFILLGIYITQKTPVGRHIFAIGGNERAAELSGINVERVHLLVYSISGLCSAMAGLIIASELQAGHPSAGESFELNAIAAVVLGGTSLAGGRGSIWGTIIGAFIIGFLSDGLVILNVSIFWQMVIKGAVIVVAVIVDQVQEKIQRKQFLSKQINQ